MLMQIYPLPIHIMKDFFSVFYENSKQKLPKKQTTEKITVEIDAKICFGKHCKNLQVFF